jgi:hypothetical protein
MIYICTSAEYWGDTPSPADIAALAATARWLFPEAEIVEVGHMPSLDDSDDLDDLVAQEAMQDAVWATFCGGLTVSEVARQYGLATSTVRRACERGQVSARLVGKTWLINTTAAWQRWGVSRPKRGRRPRTT